MAISIHAARSTIFSVLLLADLIIRRLLPSSSRYIFSPFNSFQRLSTLELVIALKSVEMFSPATFRIFLHGKSRRKVRTAPLGLK
jgi:hypothetical protein